MDFWRQLRFLPHIILLIVALNAGSTIVQSRDFHPTCVRGENYTINSQYESNLKTILSTLASNTDRYGFYSSSIGENSDRVDVVMLCRGDVELDICRSCVNDSATELLKICSNFKEALGGYDECMIRYRPINVPRELETPSVYVYNAKYNVSSVDEYNQVLEDLLVSLRDQAASGGTHLKFAAGDKMGPDAQHIYALVQCTPNLSKVDCIDCLNNAMAEIRNCCDHRIGGRVLKVICNLQYETNYKFFNTTRTIGAPGKKNGKTIIIIVVLAVTSVILVIVSICILRRKKKQMKSRQKSEICEDVDEISAVESLRYAFSTISLATDNFSEANKLGQGGFGAVYKAWRSWREGTVSRMIDPTLMRDSSRSTHDMIRCIHIGLLCVQENITVRPTMASVVLMLNSFSMSLAMPLEPAFILHGDTNPETQFPQQNNSPTMNHVSRNEVSITELDPR